MSCHQTKFTYGGKLIRQQCFRSSLYSTATMREAMNVYLEFGTEGGLVYSSTLAQLLGKIDK